MKDRGRLFQEVYKSGEWGRNGDEFCSGVGSHDPIVVNVYLRGVSAFMTAFSKKPNVVDFGCGDFNVGSQLRGLCDRYVACDIVPELIEHNKQKFAELDVDFRTVNAFEEDIPMGEVIFIRQVLQHMSNRDILLLLPKFKRFRYIVFTDHRPILDHCQPNVDIETGAFTRIRHPSALSLTAHPFYLEPRQSYSLGSVISEGGLIVTTAFQMY